MNSNAVYSDGYPAWNEVRFTRMEDDANSEEWTNLSAEVEDEHITNLNQNDTTPVAVGTELVKRLPATDKPSHEVIERFFRALKAIEYAFDRGDSLMEVTKSLRKQVNHLQIANASLERTNSVLRQTIQLSTELNSRSSDLVNGQDQVLQAMENDIEAAGMDSGIDVDGILAGNRRRMEGMRLRCRELAQGRAEAARTSHTDS